MSPIATAITATAASPPPKPDTASPPDDVSSPTKPQGPLAGNVLTSSTPPAASNFDNSPLGTASGVSDGTRARDDEPWLTAIPLEAPAAVPARHRNDEERQGAPRSLWP